MPILEVHHIEKHFGATRVLEDISFDLEQGQALAIIGSSGSGKTTLLRCLNFLETPDQGQIVQPVPPVHRPAERHPGQGAPQPGTARLQSQPEADPGGDPGRGPGAAGQDGSE